MTDDAQPKNAEIWTRVNQQGDQISQLAKSQAATDAQIAHLAKMVESGFTQIFDEIRHWRDRDTKPTNWIGIGSLLFTTMVITSGFVLLITEPQSNRIDRLQAEINAFHANVTASQLLTAEERGTLKARSDLFEVWLNNIERRADENREIVRDLTDRVGHLDGEAGK